jgi:hypothetical protein
MRSLNPKLIIPTLCYITGHIGCTWIMSYKIKLNVNPTRQAVYLECNTEARLHNHCCRGKAMSITHSQCASVALVIQHARHMCRIVPSSVACLALPYFFTLPGKWHRVWKKVIEHKMFVLISSATFIWNFLNLHRIQQDIIINIFLSSCKGPIILVRLQWILNFLDSILKNPQVVKFNENPLLGAKLFHAHKWIHRQTDRHTDMMKLMVAFCNFMKAPKNSLILFCDCVNTVHFTTF